MRIVKWKTLIKNPHAFEYEESRIKGLVIVEYDLLTEEEIGKRIEERILTKEQRENRVSEISLEYVPAI